MGNAQLLGVQFDPKYIGQPSNFEDSVCALIVVTPERVNKGVHWIWRRRFHQGSRSSSPYELHHSAWMRLPASNPPPSNAVHSAADGHAMLPRPPCAAFGALNLRQAECAYSVVNWLLILLGGSGTP